MASLYDPEAVGILSELIGITQKVKGKSKNTIKGLLSLEFNSLARNKPGDEAHETGILNWFFSLTTEQRTKMLMLHERQQNSLILNIFSKKVFEGEFDIKPRIGTEIDHQLDIIESFFYIKRKHLEDISMKEREFESQIRLTDTNCYLDTITVNYSLISEPEVLLDYFTALSNNQAFKVPCRESKNSKKNRIIWEFPPWLGSEKDGYFSLPELVCAILEQSLWVNYWSSFTKEGAPKEELGYTSSIYQLFPVWETIRSDRKLKIIGKMQHLQREFQTSKQKLIPQVKKRFQCIPHSELPIEFTNNFELESVDYIQNIIFYQTNSSLNLIFEHLETLDSCEYLIYLATSSLDRSLSLFDLISRKVLLKILNNTETESWENLLSDSVLKSSPRPVKRRKRVRKSSDSSTSSASSLLSPEADNNECSLVVNRLMRRIMKKLYKSIDSGESESVGSSSASESSSVSDDFQLVKTRQKKRKSAHMKQPEKVKNQFPEGNKAARDAARESKRKITVRAVPALTNQATFHDFEFPPLRQPETEKDQLHMEIAEFYWKTAEDTGIILQCIASPVAQLNSIVSSLFPGNSIAAFGSYASGIQLPSSDIDLMITPGFLGSEIEVPCLQLEQQLKQLPWVLSVKSITSASVPIVKFKGLISGEHFTKVVKIDITVRSHMGGNTTELTRSLLVLYPSLGQIAIVIKTLLVKYKLNKPYKGGINGYSVILWVVAYINSVKDTENDLGQLFLRIMEFYGKKFDISMYGINIQNGGSFFSLRDKGLAGCTTIDPTCPHNNTTKSSYQILEVLRLFAWVYDETLKMKEKGMRKGFLHEILKGGMASLITY